MWPTNGNGCCLSHCIVSSYWLNTDASVVCTWQSNFPRVAHTSKLCVVLSSAGYEKCSTIFLTINMAILDRFCIFANVCTIRKKNEYSTVQVQTVWFQPYDVSTLPGKTKNSTKTSDCLLSAVSSVEQIVTNFCRKSFNISIFPCLLENSFSSLLTN